MIPTFYGLTVILDKDISKNDIEPLIAAIKMFKHVLDVKGEVAKPATWMAEARAIHEIKDKICNILNIGKNESD